MPCVEFNVAQVHAAIAEAVPDREAIVWRDRRITYGQLNERTNRLANVLLGAGLGAKSSRDGLAGHESHNDHLAIYLYNGNEYLESMEGAFKARVAPFNVNYRYVAEELRYLLNDSQASALVFQSCFAPNVAEVRDALPNLKVLLQVADDSGTPLLDGAQWYEDALEAASPDAPEVEYSPDDIYILYTGGTTGMPKGVLWRSGDIFVASFGGRAGTEEWSSIDAIVEVAKNGGSKVLPGAPFMHGAGHWVAMSAFTGGNTVVIQDDVVGLDPADMWSVCANEGASMMLIVGDAFGRPLADEIEANPDKYDLSSLFAIISGGAPLNSTIKDRLLAALPGKMIIDAVGSSETGTQMSHVSAGGGATTGTFTPGAGCVIVDPEMTKVLDAGHEEVGWLAQMGRVPLGYLGDAEKTAKTFPVIDGVRYSVPGDRARLTADNIIELYGRDSVTINSGGEKIFAEEVEQAFAHHPDVYDITVAGRPSEKWGAEVVAIVQLREGVAADDVITKSLLAEAEKHIARYKLPKAFKFVEHVQRSPSGKADYRWAKAQAEDA